MKIVAIEPTPNPNAMKLNLDQTLPSGMSFQFAREDAAEAPAYIQRLLRVEGVKRLYHVADFIALAPWLSGEPGGLLCNPSTCSYGRRDHPGSGWQPAHQVHSARSPERLRESFRPWQQRTRPERIHHNLLLRLYFARRFGLGLSIFTPEDDFAGAGLEMPIFLDGSLLTPDRTQFLFAEMNLVFEA